MAFKVDEYVRVITSESSYYGVIIGVLSDDTYEVENENNGEVRVVFGSEIDQGV